VCKPQRKSPLERPRHRWEDKIKIGLKEIGWRMRTGFIWLRIGTVAGSCKHGNEPTDSIKAV
jgi:hypothetical protein